MVASKFYPSETSSVYLGLKPFKAMSILELFTVANIVAFVVFCVDILYCITHKELTQIHLVVGVMSIGGAVLLRRFGLKRLRKKIAATKDEKELERLSQLNDKDLWNEAALHTFAMGLYVIGALATASIMLPLLIVPFVAVFWKKYTKFVAWYHEATEAMKQSNTFDDEWKEFGNWIYTQKLPALKPAQLVEQYAKFCENKAAKPLDLAKFCDAKPVEAVKSNVLEQTAKDRNLRLEKEGLIVAWEFGKDFPVITGNPARVTLVKSEKGENLFAIYLDSELATGYQCK